MAEEKIIIEIRPDGSISAMADGFKGDLCMNALDELLGKNETFTEIKPSDEFYQEVQIVSTQKTKAGRQ